MLTGGEGDIEKPCRGEVLIKKKKFIIYKHALFSGNIHRASINILNKMIFLFELR